MKVAKPSAASKIVTSRQIVFWGTKSPIPKVVKLNPEPLWETVAKCQCYFYVTDGWKVYPQFIPDADQIICKTYMTRFEGENTRLRHYLARLHRKTLCYSKSLDMLEHSIRLLIHYLKFLDVPVPYVKKHVGC